MTDESSCEDLMRRAATGNQRAYEQALKLSASMVRPYIRARLSSAAEAEDVVQEILLSVHRARATYDSNRPYRPWLFAIATYRLQDYLRRLYGDRLRSATELSELDNLPAETVTFSGIAYEDVKEHFQALPEKQARIIDLMHREGYTAKEAAALVDMKESAVKVAAFRAYKALRKKLSER